MTDAEIRERSTLTLLRIIARQEDEIEGLRKTLASTAQVDADAEKREADAVSAEHLHSQEWSKSLPTITPAYFREVADGLANQNSHYERVAARFAASADMLQKMRDIAGFTRDASDLDMRIINRVAVAAVARAEEQP